MEKKMWRFIMMTVVISTFMVVPTFVLAAEPQATTITACDNFGREWSITYDTVTKSIRGCRDLNNELGCGCLPVYGVLSGGHFGMSALDTAADSCLATYWEGDWAFGSGSGSVYNESGYFGTFTLTPCAGAAGGPESAKEPARQ